MTNELPTAGAVIIGDEILSGRTADVNINTLAKFLDSLGIMLREVRIVADSTPAIVTAINATRKAYDHVFTSGGIGPTHDDITADAIAKAFSVPIGIREDARAILEKYYPPEKLNESRLRMARIPEGATLIENPVSAAPGFRMENVWVMAGVPAVFAPMLESSAAALGGGTPLHSRSISAAVPEGSHASELRKEAEANPQLKIGSYPFARSGRVGTTVVVRGPNPADVDACVARIQQIFVALNAESIEII